MKAIKSIKRSLILVLAMVMILSLTACLEEEGGSNSTQKGGVGAIHADLAITLFMKALDEDDLETLEMILDSEINNTLLIENFNNMVKKVSDIEPPIGKQYPQITQSDEYVSGGCTCIDVTLEYKVSTEAGVQPLTITFSLHKRKDEILGDMWFLGRTI